jgi:hypothetical protein
MEGTMAKTAAKPIERKTPSYWAERDGVYDCTGHIGQLFKSDCEWPMYSFDRPSYIFWNAVAKTFHGAGWSDDQIREWLQSKDPRYALDGSLHEAIEAVAEDFAKTICGG